jgi:hypothetical protein
MVGCPIFPSILIAKYLFIGSIRERPFNLKGEGGYARILPMNRYLAINIEGKIGQPTIIRTSSFINQI